MNFESGAIFCWQVKIYSQIESDPILKQLVNSEELCPTSSSVQPNSGIFLNFTEQKIDCKS